MKVSSNNPLQIRHEAGCISLEVKHSSMLYYKLSNFFSSYMWLDNIRVERKGRNAVKLPYFPLLFGKGLTL